MKVAQLLCAISVLSLYATSYAVSKAPAKSPTGSVITLTSRQQPLTIRLHSNPTTGYRWFLSRYPDKLIRPISQRYVADSHPAGFVGGGGTSIWQFRVLPAACLVPQRIRIGFSHVRSWEAPAADAVDQAIYVYCGVGEHDQQSHTKAILSKRSDII